MNNDICVGGVIGSPPLVQGGDGRSNRTPALQISPKALVVRTIPHAVAAELVRRHHYLHSAPAAVRLSLGVFAGPDLLGTAIFNAGPIGTPKLFGRARSQDVLCLARLWLDDCLPKNSESRVLAIMARFLKRHTRVKALVAYSDPAVGHSGGIYRGAGWLFLGEAEAQPLMRLGGGPARHLRSIGSALNSHSARYLRSRGLDVEMVQTVPKLRYVRLLDASWRARLTVEPQPYPKPGGDSD